MACSVEGLVDEELEMGAADKVFVGNLPFQISSSKLRRFFEEQVSAWGAETYTLLGATVREDRVTGKSRGFGFVTFGSADEADRAIAALEGVQMMGRTLTIASALKRGTSSAALEMAKQAAAAEADADWITTSSRKGAAASSHGRGGAGRGAGRGGKGGVKAKKQKQKSWGGWAAPSESMMDEMTRREHQQKTMEDKQEAKQKRLVMQARHDDEF